LQFAKAFIICSLDVSYVHDQKYGLKWGPAHDQKGRLGSSWTSPLWCPLP
jgi:hypothetical protein